MIDQIGAKVFGLPECRAALLALPDKLRNRVVRNALAAGARIYRDEAKRLVPVLRIASKYRKPGTVRNAIRVRTSKRARQRGDVGVFVNVVPAKGAKYATVRQSGFKVRVLKRKSQRGAQNPNDPFYWRFLEFGTKKMAASKYLTRATQKTGQALAKITLELTKGVARITGKGGT